MKIYHYSIFFASLLFSCKNENKEVEKRKNDSLVESKIKDSLLLESIKTPEGLKKYLDSLSKAGVKFTIKAEEANGVEKVTAEDTKNLKATDLKLINIKILDSLVKTSTKKYTLLHFWATWCGPCRREFPEFIAIAEKLRNTEVILISTDYDSEEQRKTVFAIYKKLNTVLPYYLAETIDKTDAKNDSGRIRIIKHYDKKGNDGLPYNLLIENKTKKFINGSSNYQKTISFVQ